MPVLAAIENNIQVCEECNYFRYRHRVVVGEGMPGAKIMFVADYPGKVEDKRGRPLVGDSGQFFRQILKKFAVDDNEIYFTNALKCIPASTSNISDKALKICKRWTVDLIQAVDPILVVCMGDKAVQQLIGTSLSTTFYVGGIELVEIPGQLGPYVIPVGILPNPAYILREYGRCFRSKAKRNLEMPLELKQYFAAIHAYIKLVDTYCETLFGQKKDRHEIFGKPFAFPTGDLKNSAKERVEAWKRWFKRIKNTAQM